MRLLGRWQQQQQQQDVLLYLAWTHLVRLHQQLYLVPLLMPLT
jgi:hypothetical protein